MIRYITRHGQVFKRSNEEYDHMYPPGDVGLSVLGKKQAILLGKRTKSLKFEGIIVSSPYIRCLQTAELIARETGCKILPYAPVQEIFRYDNEEDARAFKGLTIDEIRQRFEFIDPDCTLEHPWWPISKETYIPETSSDVKKRVIAGVKELDEKYPDKELLYIGHGASSGALLRYYQIPVWPNYKRTMLFNCSLSRSIRPTRKLSRSTVTPPI